MSTSSTTNKGWLLDYVLGEVDNKVRRRGDPNRNDDNNSNEGGGDSDENFTSVPQTLQILSRGGNFFNVDDNNKNYNNNHSGRNTQHGSFTTTDGEHSIRAILTKNCLNDIHNRVTRHLAAAAAVTGTLQQQSKFWEYSSKKCGVIRKYKLIIEPDDEPHLLVDMWEPKSGPIEALLFGQTDMPETIRYNIKFRCALQQLQPPEVEDGRRVDDIRFGDIRAALNNDALYNMILNRAAEDDDDDDDDTPNIDQMLISPLTTQKDHNDDDDDETKEEEDGGGRTLFTQPSMSQSVTSPPLSAARNNKHRSGRHHQEAEDEEDDRNMLLTQPSMSPTVSYASKYRPGRHYQEDDDDDNDDQKLPASSSKETPTKQPRHRRANQNSNKKQKQKRRRRTIEEIMDIENFDIDEFEQQQKLRRAGKLSSSSTTTKKECDGIEKKPSSWRDLVYTTTDEAVIEAARNPAYVKDWQGLSKLLPGLILDYREDEYDDVDLPDVFKNF